MNIIYVYHMFLGLKIPAKFTRINSLALAQATH